MLKIYKISSASAIDYAADELRKYLRMMMPECGNIEIKFDTGARDGFRLGLMQDFGLDVSDAKEPDLDDILYIDTDTEGGIIAGDNPRSVLLSVYEYLRQNGCRWLMPGVDGEFIPMQDIVPVKYRHKPTSRYRGWCNEGAEYQSDMYDAIEFLPKVGMNLFMMEFFIPAVYYRRYYEHLANEKNRPPEPITPAQMLQYKRACEGEISRRGLMFHDIGHGWCMEPFGIDTSRPRSTPEENERLITDGQRKHIALVNGERKLCGGSGNHTQFCMSPPEARTKVAKFVAEYAEKHSNSDYIHVWLGDGINNHCECEACQKKSPTDWYVMLLNEIDEELAKRNLSTRIVYIAYTETMWAPETVKIKNPARFAMLFAPSGRIYTEALRITDENPAITPYVRNKNFVRKDMNQLMWHFKDWTRDWTGANLSYEYHFWRHMIYDVGGVNLAKIINEDVKFYGKNNIHGIIEDGSQRAFFPTGYMFYTYARTLFDSSLSIEDIREDYFKHAFGDGWQGFYACLEKMTEAFGHTYLSGEANYGTGRTDWYNPSKVESLSKVKGIADEARKLVSEYYNSEYRVRTVSVRLFEFYLRYTELFAEMLMAKCVGNDEEAVRLYELASVECGAREIEFERWYDHGLFFDFIGRKIKQKTVTGLADLAEI